MKGTSPAATPPGAAAGDRVCGGASQSLSRSATDSLARIDQTRFAIVAPFSDDHVAYVLGERMLHAIAARDDGTADDLSARFGVASFPSDAREAQELVDAASHALAAAEEGTAPPVAKFSHTQVPDEPGEAQDAAPVDPRPLRRSARDRAPGRDLRAP